jgi:hypothetical protein
VDLHSQFELRELQRDDGVLTFSAREIATGRPVQVHLFDQADSSDTAQLLTLMDRMNETQKWRVVARGEHEGAPYVVTQQLIGQPSFRDWLTPKPSLDDQFLRLFEEETATPTASRTRTNLPVQDLDRQFLQLFETEAPASVRVAARSALALVLGVLAAIVVLGLAIAIFAFRRL